MVEECTDAYTQTDKVHVLQLSIQSLKPLVQADSRDKQNPTSGILHKIRFHQNLMRYCPLLFLIFRTLPAPEAPGNLSGSDVPVAST